MQFGSNNTRKGSIQSESYNVWPLVVVSPYNSINSINLILSLFLSLSPLTNIIFIHSSLNHSISTQFDLFNIEEWISILFNQSLYKTTYLLSLLVVLWCTDKKKRAPTLPTTTTTSSYNLGEFTRRHPHIHTHTHTQNTPFLSLFYLYQLLFIIDWICNWLDWSTMIIDASRLPVIVTLCNFILIIINLCYAVMFQFSLLSSLPSILMITTYTCYIMMMIISCATRVTNNWCGCVRGYHWDTHLPFLMN